MFIKQSLSLNHLVRSLDIYYWNHTLRFKWNNTWACAKNIVTRFQWSRCNGLCASISLIFQFVLNIFEQYEVIN